MQEIYVEHLGRCLARFQGPSGIVRFKSKGEEQPAHIKKENQLQVIIVIIGFFQGYFVKAQGQGQGKAAVKQKQIANNYYKLEKEGVSGLHQSVFSSKVALTTLF